MIPTLGTGWSGRLPIQDGGAPVATGWKMFSATMVLDRTKLAIEEGEATGEMREVGAEIEAKSIGGAVGAPDVWSDMITLPVVSGV